MRHIGAGKVVEVDDIDVTVNQYLRRSDLEACQRFQCRGSHPGLDVLQRIPGRTECLESIVLYRINRARSGAVPEERELRFIEKREPRARAAELLLTHSQYVCDHHAVENTRRCGLRGVEIHVPIDIYHSELRPTLHEARQYSDRHGAVTAQHQQARAAPGGDLSNGSDLRQHLQELRKILPRGMVQVWLVRGPLNVAVVRHFMARKAKALDESSTAQAVWGQL